MSRQTFRLNLLAADFPLLSDNYGRSIVYAQQDMHYQRPNAFSGTEADKNLGIPQLIFCENVMPSSYGLQSISYSLVVNRTGINKFSRALYLRDAAENRTLFDPGYDGAIGHRYTYNATTQIWSFSDVVIPVGAKVTVCTVKKRTFVHYEFGIDFYEWNGAWAVIAFTGITAANIKGLVAANAYNILYDKDTIYWSSTLDPTDFVPSLVTGAGSQKILAIKGEIVVCYPIDNGFVIYTTGNVVIAKYSNNTRFPWNFTEVKNSAGIQDQEHATPQGDNNTFYVYTTNGLAVNTPQKSSQDFPQINEFLGSRRMEVWNAITSSLEITDYFTPFLVKIEFVANRWLVLSYGVTELTHALIFDSALKRWGKLKITHVDCFEYFGNVGDPGSITAVTWAQLNGTWAQQNNTWFDYGGLIIGGAASLTVPYKSLAFLQKDGGVLVVNFDNSAIGDGVMLLGKIQFLRNKLFQLLEVEAEGMDQVVASKLQLWCSMDGLNIDRKIYPSKAIGRGRYNDWVMRETAINFTLAFLGSFKFTTVIARGVIKGDR